MVNTSKILAAAAFALMILVSGSPAVAQTDEDRIRARVKEGQKVTVTDEQGREYKGRIASLTNDRLRLASSGAGTELLYGQIVRIDRPRDTLSNGALIGFAAGAALGFAAMLSEDTRECSPGAFFDCGDPSAGSYIGVTAITAGLGAAIGVGVDALIRRDGNLYQRGRTRVGVSPSITRSGAGARLSISW